MKKRSVPKGNKNIYIIFGLLALIFGILIYLSMQNKRREGMETATEKPAPAPAPVTATKKPATKKPAETPAETGTEAAITDMLNDALKKIK